MEKNMLKAVGRLDTDDVKELDSRVEKILKQLQGGKHDLAKKKIFTLSNTANYFVRDSLGKLLAQYEDTEVMDEICLEMLDHKIYGIRATGLFYFYYKNLQNPRRILTILEKTFETIPWEAESIAFEMWKRNADVMKEIMPLWTASDNEKKRALSMHGMENIAGTDPQYIMNFVGNLIDDQSLEVQKKITHILTQVGRLRPNQCYPHIRQWLLEADDKRIKTIWVSMKKLANILVQRSKRDKSQEFIVVTQKIVKDWKADANPNVAQMGTRLHQGKCTR
jgi:3-methyladenine DNA glycosylase AlkC